MDTRQDQKSQAIGNERQRGEQGMSKHSQGPWRLENWTVHDQDGALEACGYQVVDAGGHALSTFITEGATESEEADICLMAAAPELLAALQEIASEYRKVLQETLAPQHQKYIDTNSPVLKQARAAIAKATDTAAQL